jgi:hypothetical protein
MSPSPVLSGPLEAAPQSHPVFVDAGLLSPFNLKRAAYFLLVPLPLLGLCVHFGQGVLGLALLVAGAWPFRPRCRVEAAGLRISWLVVRERVAWDEIVEVELGEDGRPGIVGKRPHLLTIKRRGKPPLVLRGRADVLERLTAELARRS